MIQWLFEWIMGDNMDVIFSEFINGWVYYIMGVYGIEYIMGLNGF